MDLIASNELALETPGAPARFLDEHRLALHLDHLYHVEGEVDLSTDDPPAGRWIPLADAELVPGEFYLGVTSERIALGSGVAASLHTRSRYARLGLEVLCSSNFVVPGFGSARPAPLVFEITVRRCTTGLSSATPYCFALIYRIPSPRQEPNTADYNARFPIMHLADRVRGAHHGRAALHRHMES
jgi:hypothetical protein